MTPPDPQPLPVIHGLHWYFGLYLGALIVGAASGLIPLVLGLCLKQRKLGYLGLLVCVVCGLLFGLKGITPPVTISCVAVLAAWRRQRETIKNRES